MTGQHRAPGSQLTRVELVGLVVAVVVVLAAALSLMMDLT